MYYLYVFLKNDSPLKFYFVPKRWEAVMRKNFLRSYEEKPYENKPTKCQIFSYVSLNKNDNIT